MVIQTVRGQLTAIDPEKKRRFLLAVSTGVDSMVLLQSFCQLFPEMQKEPCFGVAHVNHQLRPASAKEAAFLRQYCQERGIPFYERCWENPPETGVEASARNFRYTFFADVMSQEGYDVLLTAHHSDDQVETMLMKMMREGRLRSAGGMKQQQPFHTGVLLRPLLTVSKAAIYDYAQAQQIPYFEDESNHEPLYLRNRLRQQVVPALKAENPQLLPHFQQLSEEVQFANQLIQQEQQQWLSAFVQQQAARLVIDLQQLPTFSPAQRYFFYAGFLQQAEAFTKQPLNQKQLPQVLRLLDEKKGQWQLALHKQWQLRRSYDQLLLEPVTVPQKPAAPLTEVSQRLVLGEGIYLSEKEWIGYFPINEQHIPKKITNWSEFSQDLPLNYSSELVVRKRQPGDRIRLARGLTKKISRFFIDSKIPNEVREKSWVVTNLEKEVIALLPHTFSYLSIAPETDKIHYILLYKYQE
ncbi:tRNA lysidine(34) synthetase TilS [Enterococcus casseliflavus]|uniref:tRNA lysidine(34) synthetase TilS n=1 Tax=Enterococcus casseliflavus TaxID=37734 RepID=UPI003D11F1DE